ncbi:hypothetical protein BH23ACT11_BH23ACT11_04460 [soil metagenome]
MQHALSPSLVIEAPPAQELDARFAVLRAIRRTPDLWSRYVIKGGLALQHAYGSPRRSHDLDISAIEPRAPELSEANEVRLVRFCHQLNAAMELAAENGFVRMVVQRRRLSDEIPALLAQIGYSTDPDAAPPFDDKIELQVTLSEVVCETTQSSAHETPMRVPTLEDVLAEKLKALAQQSVRPSAAGRASDVYDVWYFTTDSPRQIDRDKVAVFLKEKVTRWPAMLPIVRSAFDHPFVRERAHEGFDALRESIAPDASFPCFEEAFAGVRAFVASIALPEG